VLLCELPVFLQFQADICDSYLKEVGVRDEGGGERAGGGGKVDIESTAVAGLGLKMTIYNG